MATAFRLACLPPGSPGSPARWPAAHPSRRVAARPPWRRSRPGRVRACRGTCGAGPTRWCRPRPLPLPWTCRRSHSPRWRTAAPSMAAGRVVSLRRPGDRAGEPFATLAHCTICISTTIGRPASLTGKRHGSLGRYLPRRPGLAWSNSPRMPGADADSRVGDRRRADALAALNVAPVTSELSPPTAYAEGCPVLPNLYAHTAGGTLAHFAAQRQTRRGLGGCPRPCSSGGILQRSSGPGAEARPQYPRRPRTPGAPRASGDPGPGGPGQVTTHRACAPRTPEGTRQRPAECGGLPQRGDHAGRGGQRDRMVRWGWPPPARPRLANRPSHPRRAVRALFACPGRPPHWKASHAPWPKPPATPAASRQAVPRLSRGAPLAPQAPRPTSGSCRREPV